MFGCLGRVVEYPRRELYVHMHRWSGRPLGDRLWVSISSGSRRDVGRAPCMAARAKSYESLMVGPLIVADHSPTSVCTSRAVDRSETVFGYLAHSMESPRRLLYVRMYLLSGRPLGDSVWLSRACGRVSRVGTLRPHAPLERSTAQRQGSGVYLPRLVTRRQTCAVYCGLGKVL